MYVIVISQSSGRRHNDHLSFYEYKALKKFKASLQIILLGNKHRIQVQSFGLPVVFFT